MANIINEYDSLRQDIRQLRAQRLIIFGSASALISAILGLISSKPDIIDPFILSGIILLIVGITTFLTYMLHLLAARAGTYIMVFHEQNNIELGWERRSIHFKDDSPFTNLQVIFSMLYLLLFLVGAISPFLISSKITIDCLTLLFFAASFLIAITSIGILFFRKGHVERYKNKWLVIKNSERT